MVKITYQIKDRDKPVSEVLVQHFETSELLHEWLKSQRGHATKWCEVLSTEYSAPK